jgi:hypothetical protein
MFSYCHIYHEPLPRVGWFLQHGINPWQIHRTDQGYFSVSHLTAATVGDQLKRLEVFKERFSEAESFADIVCQTQFHDSCRCYCSPSGCSPFKVYLHTSTSPFYSGRRRSAKRQADCWQRLTAFANKSPDFLECQLQAIRLATFDELGLAHTCCTRLWNQKWKLFAPNEEEVLELTSVTYFLAPPIFRHPYFRCA